MIQMHFQFNESILSERTVYINIDMSTKFMHLYIK